MTQPLSLSIMKWKNGTGYFKTNKTTKQHGSVVLFVVFSLPFP